MGSIAMLPRALLVWGAASAPLLAGADPAVPGRPNVVVILADDLGHGDLGPYDHDDDPGTPEVTNSPALDRMAREGVTLTDFYAAWPLCTPTRAALLTGRNPARTGIPPVLHADDPRGLDGAEITLAEMLAAEGYRTGLVGKWHLGDRPEYLPTRQGFAEFYGVPYSNDITPFYVMRGEAVVDPAPDQRYLTRNFTREARRFVTRAVRADEPFFLLLAHTAPHVPVYVSPAFDGITGRGLYADAVREIDWSTRALLEHLERVGALHDTVVVFLSDNGPWHPILGEGFGHDPFRFVGGRADPFTGHKARWTEGGVRVPCIVRLPGPLAAPRTVAGPADVTDLCATIAAWAGASLPTDRAIDGRDLRGPIEGAGGAPPKEPVFFRFDGPAGVYRPRAMRSGRHKLHFDLAGAPAEVYDVAADPREEDPLDLPSLVRSLDDRARRLECDLSAPPPRTRVPADLAEHRPVVASGSVGCAVGARAVDGDPASAWMPDAATGSLEVEFARAADLATVRLEWLGPAPAAYAIDGATAGGAWNELALVTGSDGGLDVVGLGGEAARLRLRVLRARPGWRLATMSVFASGR